MLEKIVEIILIRVVQQTSFQKFSTVFNPTEWENSIGDLLGFSSNTVKKLCKNIHTRRSSSTGTLELPLTRLTDCKVWYVFYVRCVFHMWYMFYVWYVFYAWYVFYVQRWWNHSTILTKFCSFRALHAYIDGLSLDKSFSRRANRDTQCTIFWVDRVIWWMRTRLPLFM